MSLQYHAIVCQGVYIRRRYLIGTVKTHVVPALDEEFQQFSIVFRSPIDRSVKKGSMKIFISGTCKELSKFRRQLVCRENYLRPKTIN